MRAEELRKIAAEIRAHVESSAQRREKKAALVVDAAIALKALQAKVRNHA